MSVRNVSMKPLRRYIEKKLGLPKKSLALEKSVLKDIIFVLMQDMVDSRKR